MAVPIYDDDETDSCTTTATSSDTGASKSAQSLGELSPLTAQFVQYYIDTQQHHLDHKQLVALKAWRTKYLQSLNTKE